MSNAKTRRQRIAARMRLTGESYMTASRGIGQWWVQNSFRFDIEPTQCDDESTRKTIPKGAHMDSKYGADKDEQQEDMQDVGSGGSDTEAQDAEPATPIETIADPPTTTGQFSSRDAEPPASKY